MVTRAQVSYTVEEAASFLNRAPWYVARAIARGDLVPNADGRLSRDALLAYVEEDARRDAALREVMAESKAAGLDGPDTFDRLIALGIVVPGDGSDRDR